MGKVRLMFVMDVSRPVRGAWIEIWQVFRLTSKARVASRTGRVD